MLACILQGHRWQAGMTEGNGEEILLAAEGARTVRTTHPTALENRWDATVITGACGAPSMSAEAGHRTPCRAGRSMIAWCGFRTRAAPPTHGRGAASMENDHHKMRVHLQPRKVQSRRTLHRRIPCLRPLARSAKRLRIRPHILWPAGGRRGRAFADAPICQFSGRRTDSACMGPGDASVFAPSWPAARRALRSRCRVGETPLPSA